MLPRLVGTLLLASLASAQSVELGARLEVLTIEQPLEFSCDRPCDTDEDPNCEFTAVDEMCEAATVDQPHQGWLFGFLFGVHSEGENFRFGARLAGTFGLFDPTSKADDATSTGASAEDTSITLGHITLELPLEARVGDATQLYVQIVPRVGSLNLLDGRAEEADTFRAGVVGVLGVRCGLPDGRLGAGLVQVEHPAFSGWGLDAHYLVGE